MATNSFMFHCSPRYFPAHKVVQPFYLRVEYAYKEKSFLDVCNVEIPFNAIGAISLSSNLKDEIRTAALNYHLKNS